MTVLNRKLLRELRGNLGVLAAVVAIIAVGVGTFVGAGSAQRILEASQRNYYREYQFADFWIRVKKAPLSVMPRIARLPGVAEIQPRISFQVIVDLPDETRPIAGRLISMPEAGIDKVINGICLVRGSGFSPDRDEEVILSEEFARAHRLAPGDRIGVILNRKRESFIIAGTAISPEYVYMVRGEGDFVPDPRHFGILYVKERYARDVLDFDGACNQFVGRVIPGHEQHIDALLEQISRVLDPYGVLATTPRARQASHRFLSDEIHGLGTTASVLPAIFLLVAALVLNILMGRLAERQRTIIGTLKAIGWSNRAMMVHFLMFGVVVGVAGGLAGCVLGVGMAIGMVEMYKSFFQFPRFAYQHYPDLFAIGISISLFFALAGAVRGVRAVLRLGPAESMRSKPPERGGRVFLERWLWLWRKLSFRTHIALRSLLRNPTRTATGVLSSAVAGALILMTLMMADSLNYLVDFQFEQVSRSDVDIGMRDERGLPALWEVAALPGVDYVEPVLGLACDAQHGQRQRRITVLGLSSRHRLTTPMQADGTPIDVPTEGLVLTHKLADLLNVGIDDQLDLTPVRGWRHTVHARVASIVEGYIGLGCYADICYLSRMVGEALAINSVQLAVDPRKTTALYRAIKKLPNAQDLTVRQDTVQNIESTFVQNMYITLTLMIVFAGVISLGTMLNSSLVEIGERARDIATFRVLGYRSNQVAGIFFRQNMVIFVAGLLLALPLGLGMTSGIARVYDTELFRMPVVMRLRTVFYSALTAVAFVLVAQWFVYRTIRRLDWLENVKVKE